MQTCPCCGGTNLTPLFALKNVPVICNQLWPSAPAAADAPAGDVDLAICQDCTLVTNLAFDENRMEYAPGYENALHFSPRFQAFAEELAADLVARHDLAGKDIVEIGCGDGYFLDLMVRHGVKTATGFDPTMAGQRPKALETEGVDILPEYFDRKQLDRHFDAVLCRHVLEHLPAPMGVLTEIRAAIGDRDVAVYFEVPNAEWMLDSLSLWDVIYEHVTYWGAPSLETLFRRAGFEPVRISAGYGDQFMMLEAKPCAPQPNFLPSHAGRERIIGIGERFGASVTRELSTWRGRLTELAGAGKKAAIWGAGSKGITFANAVAEDAQAGAGLAALVDLNDRKHSLYAGGVALPVVAPGELPEVRPDLVLISNALYADEIQGMVRGMGLSPEFAVIAG